MQEGKSLNIFILDDEEIILEMLGVYFTKEGFQCHAYEDPELAVKDLLSGKPCDILVSDIFMDKYNGVEVAELMRIHRPEIPVVLITGFVRFSGNDIPSNVSDIILKPFELKNLKEKVLLAIEEFKSKL
ncbi:MAG: response regulator [Candidatus Delongbacteria bacterium]|nr:response regulator [Candidatus Delongbacteria bacterium]MBN2835068.1 response regulator [Candidatus Delongbacteria bacterium]